MQANYEINKKENIYFALKVVFGIIGYGLILLYAKLIMESDKEPVFTVLIIYSVMILLFLFFRLGILVGYIKGNAVKVTNEQFPNLYNILLAQCNALHISSVPDMYLLQSGGLLNAFATSFMGSNYIVLYSEIADEMFEDNMATVEFVIGHELGHIKRKHLLKKLLTFPSFFVPFLGGAYSRACEYTCDNIGASVAPNGVRSGLILLAAGKKMWTKVNIEKFTQQENTERGFWFWFAEKVSTHPRLTKRILQFSHLADTGKTSGLNKKSFSTEAATTAASDAIDHSKYFPQ